MSYEVNHEHQLVLDKDGWAAIRRINAAGNKIVWQSDEKTWGVVERWDFPVEKAGHLFEDCDGITLWKMDAMIKEGIPAEVLLFCICHCETGEGHAVLCVTTDRGDFICDNRFPDVKSYDDLKAYGYKFLYRSSLAGKSFTDVWQKIQER